MHQPKALVTGSCGLIGSEAVRFFGSIGFDIIGIDNNMRAYFFGEEASTEWNRSLLELQCPRYTHYSFDIRNQDDIEKLFKENTFDLIVHTAAQPSHDWAAKEPLTDFSVNAQATLLLLEATRKYCPEAVFIFTSTNKVYGDTPNALPLIETETRWEIDPTHQYANGIDESMSLDQSKHSIFGASKVAADVMVQEYGRYFGIPTGVFRGGCLTGPAHSGTELHGFLAYLVKCVAEQRPYTINGYKGKQVRDNIHSADLISAFYEFFQHPRPGEVYNMGGSRFANISMMEGIEKIESYFERKASITYTDIARSGDHIWYISDVGKFQNHYPAWKYRYDIDETLTEICEKGHFQKPSVSTLVVSQVGKTSRSSVFVAAHVTESFGPVQALKAYLIKHVPSVTFVEHPFSYANLPASSMDSYRSSLPSNQQLIRQLNIPFLAYLRDGFLSALWFWKKGRKSNVFIGVDALNGCIGALTRLSGYQGTIIYYAVSYSTRRFRNPFLNKLYILADKIATRSADIVWNSTERIQAIHTAISDPDKNLIVPAGVSLEKIPARSTPMNQNRNTLVMVDHLATENGVQLAVKAFDAIKVINPAAQLIIYGTGPLTLKLQDAANQLAHGKDIIFRGMVPPEEYLPELQTYGIGLCLHRGLPGSHIEFEDAPSPKEFLACGLPVILTKQLPIAQEVAKNKLGIVIDYTENSLLAALHELWHTPSQLTSMQQAVQTSTLSHAWDDAFTKGFHHVALS